MDSLLKEMGVENNTEDDILAKALKRKIISTSSDRNPRLYGRTIALSIVENAVPEVEANPELDSIFHRRSKQLTKKETSKISQAYESARLQYKNLQVGKLNSLVGKVGAKGRHADDASIILERIGDFDSISHFDPTADLDDPFDISASYDEKKRETSPDGDYEFLSCPICEQLVKTTSNEMFNKHIDRCSRRSRGRNLESSQTSVKPNTSKKANHGELADFEDNEDEFDNINMKKFSRLRKSNRQVEENRRSSLASSNSSENIATSSQGRYEPSAKRSRDDDEYPHTDDEEGEEAIVSSALPVDDWEDEDYFERLGEVDRTALQLCETPFGTRVFETSWGALHDYQKEGCRWLYEKYRDGVGGILADEMGLGKTAQICAHFGSLAAMTELVGSRLNAIFLIVCPATVLHHWLKEMHRWSPSMRTVILHGISSTGSELCRELGDDGKLLIYSLHESLRLSFYII